MKQRILNVAAAVAGLMVCSSAWADDAANGVDARLQGYPSTVTAVLDGGSNLVSWIMLVVLAALCIGVLFINAKRTHLD